MRYISTVIISSYGQVITPWLLSWTSKIYAPLNLGQLKLAGEQAVKELLSDYSIALRIALDFGRCVW